MFLESLKRPSTQELQSFTNQGLKLQHKLDSIQLKSKFIQQLQSSNLMLASILRVRVIHLRPKNVLQQLPLTLNIQLMTTSWDQPKDSRRGLHNLQAEILTLEDLWIQSEEDSTKIRRLLTWLQVSEFFRDLQMTYLRVTPQLTVPFHHSINLMEMRNWPSLTSMPMNPGPLRQEPHSLAQIIQIQDYSQIWPNKVSGRNQWTLMQQTHDQTSSQWSREI